MSKKRTAEELPDSSSPLKKRKLNDEIKPNKKLPVTVLSGFLGSGKTTLLQHILHNNQNLKIAVIVNDMAALNIDAELVKKNNSSIIQTNESMIEMQNGCICCTLREDLLIEIKKLAQQQKYDYLVIESTGISEPMQVAETFTFGELINDETEQPQNSTNPLDVLSDIARLDTMVTVIDAYNFEHYMDSVESLSEKYSNNNKESIQEIPEEDDRNVSHLLIDQIEFANIVIINKIDLIKEDENKLKWIKALIKKLNVNAKILETEYSKIDDLKQVLNTHSFSFEEAENSKGWLKEIRGEHKPETIEYGIESFVYERRKPFHPKKLDAFLKQFSVEDAKNANDRKLQFGILRAKGFIWCCHENDLMLSWNQAGKVVEVHNEGPWFCVEDDADADDHHHEHDHDEDDDLKDNEHHLQHQQQMDAMKKQFFVGKYGDRRQQIVFIGQNIDKDTLIKQLDECMLTEDEMKLTPEQWAQFEVPETLQIDEEDEEDQDDDLQ